MVMSCTHNTPQIDLSKGLIITGARELIGSQFSSWDGGLDYRTSQPAYTGQGHGEIPK